MAGVLEHSNVASCMQRYSKAAMKTEFRGSGGGKVFKEKTQHKSLPCAKAERHGGASGAKGVLSNSQKLVSKNPAPLCHTLQFTEHCHICFPLTLTARCSGHDCPHFRDGNRGQREETTREKLLLLFPPRYSGFKFWVLCSISLYQVSLVASNRNIIQHG